MIDATIPDAIVHGVLKPVGVTSATPVAAGMSGGRVFRCQAGSGQLLALKQWPDQTPRSRVRNVHQVMQHAVDQGCSLVPRVHRVTLAGNRKDTVLSSGSAHWELTDWIEGDPAPSNAGVECIRRGAAAIAQFHHSVQDLGVQSQPAPAIRARMRRLRQLNAMLPKAIDFAGDHVKSAELADAVAKVGQLLRVKWGDVGQRISQSLSQHSSRSVPTQLVLRDVHRQHVLFSEQPGQKGDMQVAGLIDFDAMRVDTIATDLSRWAGSFLGNQLSNDQVWDAALAGFRDQSSFKDKQDEEIGAELARDLCYASVWISLANWLVWIWQQRQFPAGPTAVAARLHDLLQNATQGVGDGL